VRLRETLNAMVERLAEGLARERRFASTAAHELRTPLTQLRLSVEVALSRPRETGEYQETLRQALQDIDRLQRLVGHLLFLARDHGATVRTPVPLLDVLARALRACGSTAALPVTERPVYVMGNADLLESALRNVLENAARYAPRRAPELRLTLPEIQDGVHPSTAPSVTLEIADFGPGVPPEDRERIFEPLTRLNPGRRAGGGGGGDPEGFGLGLTVARNAVRACGGDLVCAARGDGQSGAAFVFTFALGRRTGSSA
jgi:signal transduction histidine kinase